MSILNNGLSGMLSSRQMIDVTSQNVANMNTEGYTRQGGILVSRAGSGSPLSPGNGVELKQLIRITDNYLETSLWSSQSQVGYDSQMRDLSVQLESVVGTESVSITSGVDELFEAFSQSAEAPESTTAREQVLNQASVLAGKFNQIFDNIAIQERQVNEQSKALIKTANSDAQVVADLNKKILDLKAKGGNTNTLEDQRNVAIQDLSKSIAIKINRLDDGTISVSGPSGQPIVSRFEAGTLSLVGTGVEVTMNGTTFEMKEPGGQLGGYQDYKAGILADVKTSLNNQAIAVADDINNQLNAGFDKNMNPGIDLFTYNPANPGGTIEVTNIQADELAYIGDDGAGGPNGGVGNNENLLKIIEMRPTFYNAYSDLIGEVGIESRQRQIQADSSENFLQDAKQRRDSVSAVNQDEEAVNLMKFNQSYQANAKVIGTANDLFDTIMGMF